MRTKYSSNSELAHIWANDPDSSVYKSANSMSCHYGVLYSYATAIAHLVSERNTVIINTASYSNSTSMHQGHARSASNHFDTIFLDMSSSASYTTASQIIRTKLYFYCVAQQNFNVVLTHFA